jgi:TonB family protein
MKTSIIAVGLLISFAICSISLAQEKAPSDELVRYDKEPAVVSKVQPHYPELALKSGLEGEVLLKVWVDESGDVIKTAVLKSDDKIFEEAAAVAARQWKFTPAMKEGKPIAVFVSIPFRFRLSSDAKGKSKEYDVFIQSLQSIATNIIHGSKLDQAKLSVAPEAYVIDGNHYENLFAVLNGEVKTCKVVEGPGAKIPFMSAYVTDDMTAASVVLKSVSSNGKRERYHTVLLTKQSGGEWKVKSWHVSG